MKVGVNPSHRHNDLSRGLPSGTSPSITGAIIREASASQHQRRPSWCILVDIPSWNAVFFKPTATLNPPVSGSLAPDAGMPIFPGRKLRHLTEAFRKFTPRQIDMSDIACHQRAKNIHAYMIYIYVNKKILKKRAVVLKRIFEFMSLFCCDFQFECIIE